MNKSEQQTELSQLWLVKLIKQSCAIKVNNTINVIMTGNVLFFLDVDYSETDTEYSVI